ncbi:MULTISPECIES: hypothetical protein [unclassified Phyllobacterium]|uniref:hypothetical protein n=1 Tax=unclassified Phyllobacterium TaxID=2638441 RepID=UPI003012CF27
MTMDNGHEHRSYRNVNHTEIAIIVFAAVVTAFGCWAIYQIIMTKELGAIGNAADTISKLGLFMVGVVGLPLALWKGYLDYQQTELALQQGIRAQQQMEITTNQLKLTERQVAASEENSLATILERASSLISDTQSDAQKMSGVAFLHYVAQSKTQTFHFEALELLSQLIANRDYNEPVIRSATQYMNEIGHTKKKRIRVSIRIEENMFTEFFEYLSGVTYINCTINNRIFTAGLNYFHNCEFSNCTINHAARILDTSNFVNCRIVRLNTVMNSVLEFSSCDFSGCMYLPSSCEIHLHGCYYDVENPPGPLVMREWGSELTGLKDFEIDDFHRHG